MTHDTAFTKTRRPTHAQRLPHSGLVQVAMWEVTRTKLIVSQMAVSRESHPCCIFSLADICRI